MHVRASFSEIILAVFFSCLYVLELTLLAVSTLTLAVRLYALGK